MIPALRQVIHIPNGGARPKKTSANGVVYSPEGERLRKMGVRAGAWDYLFAVQAVHDGVIKAGLWIEFKSKGGKLSDDQVEFGRRQEEHGYVTRVVRSWQDGVAAVLEYLGRTNYSGRPQ